MDSQWGKMESRGGGGAKDEMTGISSNFRAIFRVVSRSVLRSTPAPHQARFSELRSQAWPQRLELFSGEGAL